jgi:c-di-GMP-related signal transduction protein
MPGAISLTNRKRAFINVTREVLLAEFIYLIPPELAAVELLENVAGDEEVIRACLKLKKSGYLIVLDDYVDDSHFQPLVGLTDIIKVDFLATAPEERRRLANKFIPQGIQLLAEKVETFEEFEAAKQMGYSFFQGYFFARPQMLTRTEPASSQFTYINLLREIHRPDLDYHKIERIIGKEPSLSYKLLRYVNTAALGRSGEITSILVALNRLGEKLIKKWATIIVLAGMAGKEQHELVRTTIIRANLCAAFVRAEGLPQQENKAYFLGLFSTIDVLFQRPMPEVLNEIPLPIEVTAALLGKQNGLRQTLQNVIYYERGEFEKLSGFFPARSLESGMAMKCYQSAVAEADMFFDSQIQRV